MSTLEWDDTEGFECLGHSNWVICSRLSPFCSEMFQTFSPSYWGGQFLLPQRANMEKREFPQLQNWMRQWVLSAWGIHPGPFWASLAKIWAKIFDHLDLYTGGPFSHYPPRGEKGTDKVQKSKDANSIQCSQAVSHPSTNRTQHCLTSVIGRELVCSMWYGRWQEVGGIRTFIISIRHYVDKNYVQNYWCCHLLIIIIADIYAIMPNIFILIVPYLYSFYFILNRFNDS